MHDEHALANFSESVQIRLSKPLKLVLQSRAERAGKALSTYLRDVAAEDGVRRGSLHDLGGNVDALSEIRVLISEQRDRISAMENALVNLLLKVSNLDERLPIFVADDDE